MKIYTPSITIGAVIILLIAGAVGVFYNDQSTSFPSSALEKPDTGSTKTSAPAVDAPRYSSSESGEFYKPDSTRSAMPAPSSLPLENYVYPDSTILNKTSSRLELESKADAAKITGWYKDKIKQSDFNAKSFAQTNTNGIILNKLSAAKPGEKIDITIKKDQKTSNVTITVDRS